jgi:hypothetical protein
MERTAVTMTDAMPTASADQETEAETEAVTVLPLTTVPALVPRRAAALAPIVDALGDLAEDLVRRPALEIREAFDLAVSTVGAEGIDPFEDSIGDVIGERTGWAPLHERIVDRLGSPYHHEGDFDVYGFTMSQTARGGEPDIPVGAFADIPDPDGKVIGVAVDNAPERRRIDGREVWAYAVFDQESGTRYWATHEDLKAGLTSLPAAPDPEPLPEPVGPLSGEDVAAIATATKRVAALRVLVKATFDELAPTIDRWVDGTSLDQLTDDPADTVAAGDKFERWRTESGIAALVDASNGIEDYAAALAGDWRRGREVKA